MKNKSFAFFLKVNIFLDCIYFSGRVEKEILEDTKSIQREQPQFLRSLTRPPSFRNKLADGYTSSPSTTPHDDHITNGML